ncbi:MAG: YigZ family protein [Saprospiraceae bacterium]|nr:YigZ family protein [Saprospiraceae bacterium]
MSTTHYLTISMSNQSILVEKSSKFIAFSYPVTQKEECEIYFNLTKSIHPKAKHWCYAYRLGLNENNFRINDDGEPSGTAGKPILSQIDSLKITNVMVIVVRYFGGILLGTGGLIKTYKTVARNVLEKSEIVRVEITNNFIITTDSKNIYSVLKVIKSFHLHFKNLVINETSSIQIQIPVEAEFRFFHKLKTILEDSEPKKRESVYSILNCKIERVE